MEIKASRGTVLGDALLAAASIVHLGVFDARERAALMAAWRSLLQEAGISFRPDWSLLAIIGDEYEALQVRNN